MSLLQEALKRKELDEAQRGPAAGSAEKPSAVLPTDEVNLSAGKPMADGKDNVIAEPPQSMPVPAPSQPAVRPPARRLVRHSYPSTGGSVDAGGASLAAAELATPEPAKTGPSAKPGRQKTFILWIIVAVIAVLIGLTVTSGFVIFIYRWLQPMTNKITRPAYQPGKTDTMTAGGTNMVIGQPPLPAMPATTDGVTTMPHQIVATDIKKVDASNTENEPVLTKSRLRRSALALPRIKTPATSSPPARWPALKLTGILRGAGPTESTAFINGRMISAGQMIEDVTIVEIQADGVLLKSGHEKKFLRVGATLY